MANIASLPEPGQAAPSWAKPNTHEMMKTPCLTENQNNNQPIPKKILLAEVLGDCILNLARPRLHTMCSEPHSDKKAQIKPQVNLNRAVSEPFFDVV